MLKETSGYPLRKDALKGRKLTNGPALPSFQTFSRNLLTTLWSFSYNGPMKTLLRRFRIQVDVSQELKTQFAVCCKANMLTETEVLMSFVKAYLGRERDLLERLIERYRDKGAVM